MPVRFRRAAGSLACAALGLLASPLVRANNVVGAWDPTLYSWPLIPVHAVLLPDNRVLTYGTDGIASQTATCGAAVMVRVHLGEDPIHPPGELAPGDLLDDLG